jgi:hypothetical protein
MIPKYMLYFFPQEGAKRNKLNTLITFPVTALDMSHHLTDGNNANHHSNKALPLSPWRRSKPNSANHEDNLFDLYGVCNHYGNMQGGHYTGRLLISLTGITISRRLAASFCFTHTILKLVGSYWR